MCEAVSVYSRARRCASCEHVRVCAGSVYAVLRCLGGLHAGITTSAATVGSGSAPPVGERVLWGENDGARSLLAAELSTGSTSCVRFARPKQFLAIDILMQSVIRPHSNCAGRRRQHLGCVCIQTLSSIRIFLSAQGRDKRSFFYRAAEYACFAGSICRKHVPEHKGLLQCV